MGWGTSWGSELKLENKIPTHDPYTNPVRFCIISVIVGKC